MLTGHFNALFITDVMKLAVNDPKVAFEEAMKQDAFIFWNHPNWRSAKRYPDFDGVSVWFDEHTEHRPITLVFAKERSAKGIKEALIEKRTALWFENNLIGKEEFLAPLFRESVLVEKIQYMQKITGVTLKNESSVDFILENAGEYSFYNKTTVMILKAGQAMLLGVKTGERLDEFQLKFRVLNMLVSPGENLLVEINCKKTN